MATNLIAPLDKHRSWILNKTRFIKECLKDTPTKKLVRRSEEEFKNLIHSFVKEGSKELGKGLDKVYFRTMRTKWASCSSKRNLTINRLMKYLPEPILKYVVLQIQDNIRGSAADIYNSNAQFFLVLREYSFR